MRARRLDDNHRAIAQALERCGCLVQSLAALGGGVPDLLVGFRGRLYLLEVKDGQKAPSRQRLTPAEAAWHMAWSGLVQIVHSPEEALRAVGVSIEPQNRSGTGGKP